MVVKFNPEGHVVMVFGRKKEASDEAVPWNRTLNPPLPPINGMFRQPTDVTWNAQGDIFISDGYVNSRVAKYDRNGDWVKSFGKPGKGPGQLNTPHSIAADAKKLSADEAKTARDDYLAVMEVVDRHDVELAINEGRFRSAVCASQKLVSLHPDSSENVFYLAESYRELGPRNAELTSKELTGGAKKKAAKNQRKRTLEEQEAELMKTPAGQQAWKANQEKAERLYLRALDLNRFNSVAHRGIGMLYEKIGKKDEAAMEYGKYVELAPNAADTERFRRRIIAIKGLN